MGRTQLELPDTVLREGRDALLIVLNIRRHELRRLLPRVWALRHGMTAYDASYVALAESPGVPLVTTDHRRARRRPRRRPALA